jgi:hypothetical protein
MIKMWLLVFAFIVPVLAEFPVNGDGFTGTPRYYISGNPTTTSAWSETSGGSIGASVPNADCDVYLDANSAAYTNVGNVSWRSLSILSGYTSNVTFNGTILRVKYGITMDHSGTFTYPSTLNIDSVGFLWHVGSSIASYAGNSCNVVCLQSGLIDIDEAFTAYPGFTSVLLGNGSDSATITITGSNYIFIGQTADTCFVVASRSNIIINGPIAMQRSLSAGPSYYIHPTSSVQGTSNFVFYTGLYELQLPRLSIDGLFGNISFDRVVGGNPGTISLSDNITSINSLFSHNYTAGGRNIFNTKQYNLSVREFRLGASAATCTTIANMGSGTHSFSTVNMSLAHTGIKYLYLDTSNITCTGSWTVTDTPKVKVFKGQTRSSVINFTGSTASKFDHCDDDFDIVRIAKSTGVVDSLGNGETLFVKKLIIESGKFKQKKDVIFAESLIILSTDSCIFDTTVNCCGVYIRPGALPIYAAGYSNGCPVIDMRRSGFWNKMWRSFRSAWK